MPQTDLQTLASIAAIIQTVTFIVSVLFVLVQIRERNRLTRIANNRSSFQMASPYLLQLFQDSKLADVYLNGSKNYEKNNEVEQFRFIQLVFWWLILHDDIYYQYQNGLFDEKMYEGWDHELEEFIQYQRLDLYWEKEIKRFFRADFQELIEQKLRPAP